MLAISINSLLRRWKGTDFKAHRVTLTLLPLLLRGFGRTITEVPCFGETECTENRNARDAFEPLRDVHEYKKMSQLATAGHASA